jgi:hypothetical protein
MIWIWLADTTVTAAITSFGADITDYLNSLKKSEIINPTHKWIGTYNVRQTIPSKFFRWIYNKDVYDKEK